VGLWCRAPRDQACARRETLERMELSRCARGGGFDRFQCSLRPDPAAAVFFGSAGPGLRNCRGRSHLFTQKGTLSTLLLSWQGLRGTRPALAGKLGGGGAFALCAREGLIASNACSGPIPLPLYFFGSAAAGRSLRGAVGRKGCWLIVCGRRRVVVCGWCAGGVRVVGLLGIGSEGSFLSSLSRDIFKRIRT